MLVVAGLVVTAGVALLASSIYIQWVTRDLVYSDVSAVPKNSTAIVLGCAPTLRNGRPNFYFEARLDAAALLYAEGRVQGLLVSGGPLRDGVGSECDAMRDGLLSRGVPGERVTMDPLGTRTRISAERARYVFRLERTLFVSQAFHVSRAVFLARSLGLEATAFIAPSPPAWSSRHARVLVREVFSRGRSVWESWPTKKNVPER